MKFRWHREARFEAGAAARFYAERQPGLDGGFSTFWKMPSSEFAVTRRCTQGSKAVSTSASSLASDTGLSIERNRSRSKYLQSCTSSENQGTGRRGQAKSALLGSLSGCNHIAVSLVVEPDDFEYAPFAQEGGLGKVHRLFGSELNEIVEELNGALAA